MFFSYSLCIDYFGTTLAGATDRLSIVDGICPGDARELSGDEGVFGFLSNSPYFESGFSYDRSFCMAITAATDPSNTASILSLQNAGGDIPSNLTITASEVTFVFGEGSVTFPGGQFADGTFTQLQLCYSSETSRVTLYSGCTELNSALIDFGTAGPPTYATGLVSFYRQLGGPDTASSYNVR